MAGIDPESIARAARVRELVCGEWLRRREVAVVDLGFMWSLGEKTDVASLLLQTLFRCT